MAKKLVCPKCGLVMSKGSKGLWGMCAFCAINENKPMHLMDAASWMPPGEDGVLWKPPVSATEAEATYNLNEFGKGLIQGFMESIGTPAPKREWTAKDLAEHDFTRVERDLFKMTVEDVILDFGCRVWEAV